MEIKKVPSVPTPIPPTMFTMTFTLDEGWAIVMALRDAVDRNKYAQQRVAWNTWASDLDRLMRHG